MTNGSLRSNILQNGGAFCRGCGVLTFKIVNERKNLLHARIQKGNRGSQVTIGYHRHIGMDHPQEANGPSWVQLFLQWWGGGVRTALCGIR